MGLFRKKTAATAIPVQEMNGAPEIAPLESARSMGAESMKMEQAAEFRATIGYKLLHAGVFAGLAVAVVALNVGWFQFGPQNIKEFTEYYNSPFQPVWWSYYIWCLIWGLQLAAILDLFFLTSCRVIPKGKKKGRVLHAIDVYWIGGWLCTVGWILTTQYPLNNKGALWAGLGFWIAALGLFGFSLIRLHAFRGWFNLWYWLIYLGSASIQTAWLCIMVMVAVLDLMGRYDCSFNLIQGFGYGIFSASVVAGICFAIFGRDFFFAGTIMFAAVTIWINRINYPASNTAISIYMWVMFGVLAVAILIGMCLVCCLDTPRAMKRRKERKASTSSDLESGAQIKPEPIDPLADSTGPGTIPVAPDGPPGPQQFVSQ